MSQTIKIDDRPISFETESTDYKTAIKKSRKITLTRPGESSADQNDGTDIATAMAATLCHEINNPLMTITAMAEVLLSNHKELSPEIIEKISVIAASAGRIKDATHKLISLDSLKYCETAASKMILTDDSNNKSDHPDRKLVLESSE